MDTANSPTKLRKFDAPALRILASILLIGLLLLSSCQSTSSRGLPNATETQVNILPTMTAVVAPSQTPLPTLLPTAAATNVFRVNSLCPSISTTFPMDRYEGVISYFGRYRDFAVLLNMENDEAGFLPNETIAEAISSPDRTKIAYDVSDPNDGFLYLHVRVLNTHEALRLPWPPGNQGLAGWLDNERLLFTTY
ncbi:MAG: hypothetical protein WCC12_14865 [Anaerolineales bacterium]